MPQQVFISFLGAIPYHDTCYYWLPDRSDLVGPLAYIQEAVIRNCLPAWSQGDKVFIFTTAEAKLKNYDHRMLPEGITTPGAGGQGLASVLQRLREKGLIGHFEPVIIPNGYTEQEILQVFQLVFERIEPGAAIYFDITVGFRSLPMLGIVLLNYAKHVKGAQVKAIYYGNYEAGRAEKASLVGSAGHKQLDAGEIARLVAAPIQSPILNLISLSMLQDWTAAAAEFIQLGKTENLAGLVAETHPLLAKQLVELEQSIATCRGKLLTRDLDFDALKQSLSHSKIDPIKEQLMPLISKIEEKIEGFGNGQILENGLAAVAWCIQHGMVQQGVTFLQETLISHVVVLHVGEGMLTDWFSREMAATALMLIPFKNNKIFRDKFKKQPEAEQQQIQATYEQMRTYVKSKAPLKDLYSTLVGQTGFRNDINHCGFREDYQSPGQLREKLEKFFTEICKLHLG